MENQILLSQFFLSPTTTLDQFKELLACVVKEQLQHLTPSSPPIPDELLKASEAAALLKISKVSLFAWRKKGIISAHRIASRIYYKRSELMQALQNLNKYEKQ